MTLYQLTQAIARRKRFVVTAGLALLLLAVAASFKFENGLSWRSGEKWEAGVQIAVVSPGNASLANAETRTDFLQAAAMYAGLLQSNEAATAVGEANGFQLDEPITATVATDSSLITATLIAPGEEQARSAALSIFDYLREQLAKPLTVSRNTTSGTIPTIELTGPFESQLTLSLDPALESVSDEVFLRVESEVGTSLVVPVARSAGQAVTVQTTLAPVMGIVLSLEDTTGVELDTLRLAPPAVDGHSAYYPTLTIGLDADAISPAELDGEDSWGLDQDGVEMAWEPGIPVGNEDAPSVVPVDVALVTTDPVPVMIGGRRGPIILGVVLILGAILILTTVVVAESWNREREAARTTSAHPVRQHDSSGEGSVHEVTSWEPLRVDRDYP